MSTLGIYVSHWSSYTPAEFKKETDFGVLDFMIIRARGGGYDDSKFTFWRRFAETTPGKNGAILWGGDMFLGYAPGSPSGLKQAQDFWQLINAGGKTWEIPPEIDVEFQPKEYDEKGRVKSYWPVPSKFVSTWLEPAVKYLQDRLGYSPMIYASPNTIEEFLLKDGQPDWLLSCPLHVANYGVDKPSTVPWSSWCFWQFTNTTTWPGISAVCLEQFNGTRAELKAWCKNPTSVITPAPEPEPEPEPQPEPQPGNVDLSEVNAKLDIIIEKLRKLEWLGR